MTNRALIAGVSGIVGRHLAEHLLVTPGWEVVGLSRHAHDIPTGVKHVAGDLTDAVALKAALQGVNASHVFITTWSRQATEAENIKVNGAMVANLLDALAGQKPQRVALVTGLKHYLGPFEAYAKAKPITPFREEQPRLPYENFYYEQEDVVFDRANRMGFAWTVHRPHTLIGYAVGNAMNMAATLGAYAAICKEAGKPFVFPGSPEQFTACVDITDGRVLAKQLAWAATTPVRRQPGLQHHQWRNLPLELDVAEARLLSRRAGRSLSRPPDAAGPEHGRHGPGLEPDRRRQGPAAEPPQHRRLLVAFRRRPGTDHRELHRYDEVPRPRLPRLSELGALIHRCLRPSQGKPSYPLSVAHPLDFRRHVSSTPKQRVPMVLLVEPMRFELTTSAVRLQRSPN